MKLERVGIIVGIVAGVVAIWYYLRGSNQGAQQVVYPNNQASGVPQQQNAANTYNIQGLQPSPSPSLIYGTPPPLPPTPAYQTFNFPQQALLGLSPQGAAAVTKDATPSTTPGSTTPGQKAKKQSTNTDCCGCGGGCSDCGCTSGSGTYQDGSGASCLAANPTEQAQSISSTQLGNLAANISSSSAAGSPVLPPTPVVAPSFSQGPSQPQVNLAAQQQPNTEAPPAPPTAPVLLDWSQISKILGLNSGDQTRFNSLAANFNGNG